MAGNLNSGRKDMEKERAANALAKYSCKTVFAVLQGKGPKRFRDLSSEVLFEVMTRIAVKSIPQTVGGAEEPIKVVHMGQVKFDGIPIEVQLG